MAQIKPAGRIENPIHYMSLAVEGCPDAHSVFLVVQLKNGKPKKVGEFNYKTQDKTASQKAIADIQEHFDRGAVPIGTGRITTKASTKPLAEYAGNTTVAKLLAQCEEALKREP